jgi:RNA polymerase primary sigma factor
MGDNRAGYAGHAGHKAGPSGDYLLKCYLEDIRKAGQLSHGDESALFRLARQGNARARERLIAANMRFVVKVALEYRACPMPLTDLISEGAIGLIHSVETFDADRGVKFISYAVWWIRSYITKALNEKGYLIRLPANQYFRLRKAQQAERFGGGAPEDEDIRMLRQMSAGCAPLDAPQAGGKPWSELLCDAGAPDPSHEAELGLGSGLTEGFLARLPLRERTVLSRGSGLGDENPLTLKEIGGELGLSAERVRQIRKRTLKRLRSEPAYAPLRERYQCLLENRRD